MKQSDGCFYNQVIKCLKDLVTRQQLGSMFGFPLIIKFDGWTAAKHSCDFGELYQYLHLYLYIFIYNSQALI